MSLDGCNIRGVQVFVLYTSESENHHRTTTMTWKTLARGDGGLGDLYVTTSDLFYIRHNVVAKLLWYFLLFCRAMLALTARATYQVLLYFITYCYFLPNPLM